jgi:hypothetical protein
MGASLLVDIRSGRIVVRVGSLQYSADCQIWLSVCLPPCVLFNRKANYLELEYKPLALAVIQRCETETRRLLGQGHSPDGIPCYLLKSSSHG